MLLRYDIYNSILQRKHVCEGFTRLLNKYFLSPYMWPSMGVSTGDTKKADKTLPSCNLYEQIRKYNFRWWEVLWNKLRKRVTEGGSLWEVDSWIQIMENRTVRKSREIASWAKNIFSLTVSMYNSKGNQQTKIMETMWCSSFQIWLGNGIVHRGLRD